MHASLLQDLQQQWEMFLPNLSANGCQGSAQLNLTMVEFALLPEELQCVAFAPALKIAIASVMPYMDLIMTGLGTCGCVRNFSFR